VHVRGLAGIGEDRVARQRALRQCAEFGGRFNTRIRLPPLGSSSCGQLKAFKERRFVADTSGHTPPPAGSHSYRTQGAAAALAAAVRRRALLPGASPGGGQQAA
jgi:hypothetical protein